MPSPEHDAYLAKITGLDVVKARGAASGARTQVVEEEDGSISLNGPAADQHGSGHHADKKQGGHGASAGPTSVAPPGTPNPMMSDCKIVHGKIHGPKNHVLCKTHGHVLDTDAKRIIASSVDEYNANYNFTPGGSGGAKAAAPPAAALGSHSAKGKSAPAADARSTNQMLSESAKAVLGVAQTNAQAFAAAIGAACDQFGGYAAGKLNAIHGRIALGELLPALAGAIMGPFAAAMGSKATSSTAQAIVAGLNETLQDKIAAASSGAPQDANDPPAAIAAIGKLTAAAKAGAAGIVPAVMGPLQKTCGGISSAAGGQFQLTKEEEAFMQPFAGASAADIGAGLVAYGLPTAAGSAKLQADIYNRMVAAFDSKLPHA